MESPGGGILGRVGEKVLGWIALGLLGLAGFAIYQLGPDGRAALWSAVWRTVVWLGFSAAWPWISRLFISRVLEVGSNWAGMALIAGLTLVNLIVGALLLTAWPSSAWGWIAALAALAVAGTYNFLVAQYLAEQAGG